ncbi:BnaCnng16660D [Brassica napus]|uniref:BnaCnng16660D protein n=1 Tax=Brassica napus TaxID=3708 RepID=A0A078IF68_BRANA|nr:BnaCnng16660D [Brassica napus]
MMKDLLTITVFHNDPKRLHIFMNFFVPLEVGCNRELHPQNSSSNRLNLCCKNQFRELVDELVKRSAHLRTTNKLS